MKKILFSLLLLSTMAHADSLRRVYGLVPTCTTVGCLSVNEAGIDFDAMAGIIKIRNVNEGTIGLSTSGFSITGRAPYRSLMAPAFAFEKSTSCLIHLGKAGIWRDSSGNMQQRNIDGTDTLMGFGSGARPSITISRALHVSQIEFIPLPKPPNKNTEFGIWHDAKTGAIKVRSTSGNDLLVGCDDENKCTHDLHSGSSCVNVDYATCNYPVCSFASSHPGCSAPDTDGDGLSDAWETSHTWTDSTTNPGVDLNCDGVFDPTVDLPLPGASVSTKDVYLEYDYMDKGAISTDSTLTPGIGHAPDATAVQRVIDAFTRQGIVLHIAPDHDLLPHHNTITFGTAGGTACSGTDTIDYYVSKATYFDPKRAPAYRYAVFGHFSSCDSVPHCSHCPPNGVFGPPLFRSSGLAELPGNDFIVSLGSDNFSGYTNPIAGDVSGAEQKLTAEAGTMMHELGHTFGLHHGGDSDDINNFKPNYVSSMNLEYQLAGIYSSSTPGDLSVIITPSRVDYSSVVLGTLNESNLDENIGVSAPSNDTDIITWAVGPTPLFAASFGPIDWDNSGTIDTGVSIDINGNGQQNILTDYNDWNILNFAFQCTAGFPNGPISNAPGRVLQEKAPEEIPGWMLQCR